MDEITINSLIAEQKHRISTLKKEARPPYYTYDDWEGYQGWLVKTIRFLNITYPNDKFVQEGQRWADAGCCV